MFTYAPVEEKVCRLKSIGKSEKEALQLIDEIDRERASFIRHYFHAEWPNRALYNLMINTKFGDEHVVETVLQQIAALEKLRSRRKAPRLDHACAACSRLPISPRSRNLEFLPSARFTDEK